MHLIMNSTLTIKYTGLRFVKGVAAVDIVAEVSPVEVVDEEVEVLAVLEGGDHIDDMGVVQFAENIFFVEDGLDAFFGDDFGFVHDFKGEGFPGLFVDDFPDSAEASLPHNLLQLEHALVVYIRERVQSSKTELESFFDVQPAPIFFIIINTLKSSIII